MLRPSLFLNRKFINNWIKGREEIEGKGDKEEPKGGEKLLGEEQGQRMLSHTCPACCCHYTSPGPPAISSLIKPVYTCDANNTLGIWSDCYFCHLHNGQELLYNQVSCRTWYQVWRNLCHHLAHYWHRLTCDPGNWTGIPSLNMDGDSRVRLLLSPFSPSSLKSAASKKGRTTCTVT